MKLKPTTKIQVVRIATGVRGDGFTGHPERPNHCWFPEHLKLDGTVKIRNYYGMEFIPDEGCKVTHHVAGSYSPSLATIVPQREQHADVIRARIRRSYAMLEELRLQLAAIYEKKT